MRTQARIRSRHGARRTWLLAMGIAAIAVPTDPAAHGQARLFVEADAGFSAPIGNLARRQEFGPAVGLNIGYRITDGWALIANTDIEMLEGTFVNRFERSAPMTLTHFGIGAERRVIRSREGLWEILGEVGAGRTHMRTAGVGSDRVVDRPFGHSCNSSFGGLTALTHPSRRATVVLRGRIRWMMTDRNQTEGLAGSLPFSAAYTLPITVGLVLSL